MGCCFLGTKGGQDKKSSEARERLRSKGVFDTEEIKGSFASGLRMKTWGEGVEGKSRKILSVSRQRKLKESVK